MTVHLEIRCSFFNILYHMIFQNSASINNLLRRHIYEIIYKQSWAQHVE